MENIQVFRMISSQKYANIIIISVWRSKIVHKNFRLRPHSMLLTSI
jgi:hypothetical protein